MAQHEFWITPAIVIAGGIVVTPAKLNMANNMDDAYVETFSSRDEVESFITRLRAAADEAWPSKPTPAP